MAGETIWRRFRRKATTGLGVAATQAPAKPGADCKEAEALLSALNHSAERVQTLWFSFLTFMLYLAIATGTTTHRMLFLESPLNLPVLNLPLPLKGFYILSPIIFVTFHFYMLLNLVLLARTAKSFEDALESAFPKDGEAREVFRMRIENALFVQLLVGGRLEREGINATLLSLMALITLALAPATLLLMLQIKFLPYHSESITWLHRGLLALDIALVWTLWPGYRSSWGVISWPKKTWTYAWPTALSAVALPYSVVVATFPDEHMYLVAKWLHSPAKLLPDAVVYSDAPNWRAFFVPVNTLYLSGEDLIDDKKLKKMIKKNESGIADNRWEPTLNLKGRDLSGADLSQADIRHVDLSGAILNRANLDYAWAENSHLDSAQLQGAALYSTRLQGASLEDASLQGALLASAQLQGASLNSARLQGADLDKAALQGASLSPSSAAAPALLYAIGRLLEDPRLSIDSDAVLSAVSTQLQGASLDHAQLQGASLDHAQLQGASLDFAQLQGATLDSAHLEGASIQSTCVWRADARKAVWKNVRVVSRKNTLNEKPTDKDNNCNWTARSLDEFVKQVPEGRLRREGVDRLDPKKPLEGEEEMARVWVEREHASPPEEIYEKSATEQWRKTACASEGAPYVIRALLKRLEYATDPLSNVKPKLAAAFISKDCAGARGVAEDEIEVLRRISGGATPPPLKH